MAIDEITGKRIKKVKTKLDLEKEEKEAALAKSENYEEELKKSLFEKDKKFKQITILDNDDEEENGGYFQETPVFQHVKRDGEWDVPLDEEIHYFDPNLSYELTGYRPINMEDGLDFDPSEFTKTARIYEAKGSYTEFPPGSKPYKDFWREQFRRCVEGYTIGKYRLTGDHYFFLNFYRMQTVNLTADKSVRGRLESFPSFLAKQYEFFHYVEMCEYLGLDVCMLKARGLKYLGSL